MYWIAPDSKEALRSHWEDSENRRLLIHNGFTADSVIEYNIDNHGLRNEEGACVDDSLLTLGCSFTFGVGLSAQHIWPTLLAKKLKMPLFNGAIAGSSADTAFRILNTLLKSGRPKAVVCLVPFNARWELIWDHFGPESRYENFGPWEFWDMKEYKMLVKAHMNEERNSLNELKNILGMTKLCENQNIPFIHADLVTEPNGSLGFKDDWGRDLQHPGRKWHNAIYDKFEQLYIDKHT